jgi:hypothetical protein
MAKPINLSLIAQRMRHDAAAEKQRELDAFRLRRDRDEAYRMERERAIAGECFLRAIKSAEFPTTHTAASRALPKHERPHPSDAGQRAFVSNCITAEDCAQTRHPKNIRAHRVGSPVWGLA